jgi:hypothetical protein
MLLAASAGLAKEGGVARLAVPLPADAEPGSTITVWWSIETYTNETGQIGPFSSPGAYIKLIGLDESEAVGRETKPGHYVAEVVVPKGGIRAAEFGVASISTVNGQTERSTMLFGFQGLLIQPAAPPPVVKPPVANPPAVEKGANPTTTPQSAAAPAVNPLAVLGGLALVLGAVGTAFSLRKRTTLA